MPRPNNMRIDSKFPNVRKSFPSVSQGFTLPAA